MRTARLGEVRGGWGGWGRLLLAVLAAGTATTCTTSKTSTHLPQPALYDPAHDLGSLFQAVQLSGMFVDSKTFADARPRLAPAEINARYASARGAPQFNLRQFVEEHFFLQAEDGIRVGRVTGVKTCALPICRRWHRLRGGAGGGEDLPGAGSAHRL